MTDNHTDQEVWLRAWVAYAQSSNSTEKRYATRWADACLKEFRERFPDPYEFTSEDLAQISRDRVALARIEHLTEVMRLEVLDPESARIRLVGILEERTNND